VEILQGLRREEDSDLSVEISFDEQLAIANITLANWPQALVEHIGRYFDIQADIVNLDYSHLSVDKPSVGNLWGFTEREQFVWDLRIAETNGSIALTLVILGHRSTGIKGSSSILRQEAYGSAVEAFRKDVLEVDSRALREIIVEETKPSEEWLTWLLDTDSTTRGRFLNDHEIMQALVFNSIGDDWISALQLVAPGRGQTNWAFESLVKKHWKQVRDYLEAYFGSDSNYPVRDVPGLIYLLFENSPTVQASRWACEQVLERASLPVFPRLIQRCSTIRSDDVRILFQRWHGFSNPAKTKDFRDCVAKAYTTLASSSAGHMPSDLTLAAIWHLFEGPVRSDQQHVVVSLRELPSEVWGRDALWNELGLAAREAWRQDLLEQVRGNSELAQGLLAFVCLWLPQIAFAEVEPVLLRLMDESAHLAFALQLSRSGPRQVQLRAKGLVRSRQGALDLDGLEIPREGALALANARSQTWLGDSTVERFIHGAVSKIEEEFCRDYAETWGEEEEALTRHLLNLTKSAVGNATDQLRHLSATTRIGYPSLSMKYRQPTKREEGAITSAGAALGADVLFLTRVVDEGRTVIQRATLVQVKKRIGTSSGKSFGKTIAIDLRQCQDLLTQSEHSYYLFATPPSPQPTLWVTPARLVGNLTQMHTSKTSVLAAPVRDASCSYADFFLHYLVGLWAGDEDEDVIAIAKGNAQAGKAPRHIVEIEVRRQAD
jgi:hypothetical protein